MFPDSSGYRLLADVTLSVHAGFVLFVLGGQILILIGWARRWSWTRNGIFRWSHLAGIGYVVLEAWFGIPCPLTILENKLRALTGDGMYEMSFIGYWLDRLLFYTAPEWVFTAVYSAFALIVGITFRAYPPRRHRD